MPRQLNKYLIGELWLSVKEIASIADVLPSTIYNRIAKGAEGRELIHGCRRVTLTVKKLRKNRVKSKYRKLYGMTITEMARKFKLSYGDMYKKLQQGEIDVN